MIFKNFFKRERAPVVLVIDDDPAMRHMLQDSLGKSGRDVQVAADGNSGLKAVRELKPALILLDLMMPGVSGFDVLKSLNAGAETRDIPVLILTARTLMGEAEKAFSLGAKGYLHKPINWELLNKKVSALAKA